MAFIGGDLAAMAVLARRFATAGAEFRAHADAIIGRVTTALEELTVEMGRLDQDARTLAEEIDAQLLALRGRATGTVWTGRHRHEQDRFMESLGADIRGIRTSIDTFADEASAMVGGALTSTMTAMREHVGTTGARAQTTAEGFAVAVEHQRASFDLVMNG